MARNPRRRRGSFLDPYWLDDAYILKPDRKNGIPGILSGTNENGQPVLIKVWPKRSGADDYELREIWHSEVRQLHRLGGYPTAADMIANLQHAGEDKVGFYLVLDPGQRRPLATILENVDGQHWLNNQRHPRNRAYLWHNLLRTCAGLKLLHVQGLLHKNLNNWAILTMGGSEPDFQLTGFEWSVRIVGTASNSMPTRLRQSQSSLPASFFHDWRDFGLLVAELMKVPISALANPKVPLSSVCDHMSISEIRLLRNLIQVERIDFLDGEVVQRKIQGVLSYLEAEKANRDSKLHVVLRLGQNSSLSQEIRDASDDHIEVSAIEEQLSFVTDDLSGSPIIIGIRSETASEARLAVQGRKLLYTITSYIPPYRDSTPTWEFAHCNSCEHRNPANVNILGSLEIEPNSLELVPWKDARKRFARSRGKVRSWDTVRREFQLVAMPPGKDQRFHRALALTQLLEALFAAADTFPVEIVEKEDEEKAGMILLRLRVREDAERDALAGSLEMAAPAIRFHELLLDDQRGDDWVLTGARQVGAREHTDTSWRFDGIEGESGGSPVYRFIGSDPALPSERPVMVAGDSLGRDVQFQRRLKALRSLADHAELLWMLVDPRRRILDSHESLSDESVLSQLDKSKRSAIAAAVETLPLYLIQGPPGVGKTRLVRELVNYTLDNDRTSRLLLTAQSNAAVDHLVETLRVDLSATVDEILVVRCRPRDNIETAGPYEIDGQVKETLRRFTGSNLVVEASSSLRDCVRDLATGISPEKQPDDHQEGIGSRERFELLALEGLIVRAANVVFATTNSRELERLNDEGSQFDWAIIEEAGKATGGELIPPLLLSYRRLMIGDHKQLAPFGAERIIKLLEQPEAVMTAFRIGSDFLGRTLRDSSMDEVLEEMKEDNPDSFAELCTLAIEGLSLFECLIENELELQAEKKRARPIAHRLEEQHRMHPAIARLVSRCFYDSKLNTHPSAVSRFEKETSPVQSIDNKLLPGAPITIVDMPYIQNTLGMRVAEKSPRWHNSCEVEAVECLLRLLRPTGSSSPSLAVLSPYSEQVRQLRNRIENNSGSNLNLAGFRPANGLEGFCGTVDSFQGNEADLVVVSLVRNNEHSNPRSALGFLTDFRRMNVLLSRARWRLILVFSKNFLETVLKAADQVQNSCEILFLSRMLDGIEDERKKGNAVVIPAERILRKAKL